MTFYDQIVVRTIYQSGKYHARKEWLSAKSLYKNASKKAKYLGAFQLAKDNPINTHLYIFKGLKKHRIKMNLAGKKIQCSSSLKHEKGESEPLLVSTSLGIQNFNANQVI